MFAIFLNWLSGGIVSKLADRYFSHLERKAASANEKERVQAETELGRLKARSENVQVFAAYKPFWVAFLLFTIPVAVWFNKVIIWDIVLGYGVTDPLRGQVAEWAQLIIENIFPSGAAVGVGAAIANAVRSLKR